jgi:protein ImuB
LPLSAESRERLELLGVRTFGQLLKLPRAGLARQVGSDALALVRAAEADGELLAAYRPTEWLLAEVELDGPLETREQLARLLEPLVGRLVGELRERYLGAGAVRLRFFPAREEGPGEVAHLLEPTGSPAAILETGLRLASQVARQEEAGARVPEWVELALGELGPLIGRQEGLFEGQSQRRRQAAQAVEELAGRFRDRLRAPALLSPGRSG